MDKKHLAIALSKLIPSTPSHISLEQYQTDGDLAADLLWHAHLNKDIQNKTVADLGCGNGILGIGAQLLGAKNVYYIDLDATALALAKENAHTIGTFLHGDITTFNEHVDTVIMNPPFGVQKRKADKTFLEHAMRISNTIYSIHKIESTHFIAQLTHDHGWTVHAIIERDFLIKKTYAFHTEKKHPVHIGIWILKKKA